MPTKRTEEDVAPCPEFLQGIKQIMAFFDISKPMFYLFLSLGLPCVYVGNRYHANTENLRAWHRRITFGRVAGTPPEEPENAADDDAATMAAAQSVARLRQQAPRQSRANGKTL